MLIKLLQQSTFRRKKTLCDIEKGLGSSFDPNLLRSEHLNNLTYHEGKAVYLTESGLYQLIMQSNTPISKSFQNLVYDSILPDIRKYGQYNIEQQYTQALEAKDQEHKYPQDILFNVYDSYVTFILLV